MVLSLCVCFLSFCSVFSLVFFSKMLKIPNENTKENTEQNERKIDILNMHNDGTKENKHIGIGPLFPFSYGMPKIMP